ncbi:hypothetical protein HLK65_28375 [Azospirillum formosense]|nr:hypothetical protein [Azospirillum formosense]
MSIENLDRMTADDERRFFKVFDAQLAFDDGAEARSHLAAGFPIYYADDKTPVGHVLCKHPSGRVELLDATDDEPRVVKVLKP